MGRPGALGLVALLGLLVVSLSSGCGATLSSGPTQTKPDRELAVDVDLDGEPLTLHLALPITATGPSAPLVVYGSGDGGWFGTAVGMFRAIARSGRPTVGFSTRAFMNIEHRRDRPLNVTHLVDAYQHVVAAARVQLGLAADAPAVLTGWSRGAALGVLVASNHGSGPTVAGLVAIGLPAREDLNLDSHSDDDATAGAVRVVPALGSRALDLYPLLERIAPRRVLVIQASHDGYLPASNARQLFGDDSATARLIDIDARNHRFDGAESALAVALVDAVNWIASAASDSTERTQVHN
jgi:hypothetical protein